MSLKENANPSRSRRWLVTINNPDEKGLSHDAIKDIMARGAVSVYWCMCDEKGDECETLHTHLYIVYQDAQRFNTLRNIFKNSHLDAPKGTSEECRSYVLKDGDKFHKKPDGSYHYVDSKKNEHDGINYSSTFEECGDLPHERQGARNDLSVLYTMIEDGMDDFDILSSNPQYMDKLTTIQRTRQVLVEKRYREQWRDLTVVYIQGPARTGKTRSVMEKYGYSSVCRITDYKHPFDQYRNQDVILFDEFRNSIKCTEMLPYLEGYPLELPCRYANRQACFTKVYIVSNERLESQYPNLRNEQPETYNAWLARISIVRVFGSDGSFKEFSVSDYISKCDDFVPYCGNDPF